MRKRISECFVSVSCDDIELLFTGQIDELDCITGNTDCKVGIFWFFRMFHCIIESIQAKYVDIQMMCTLAEIAIQYIDKLMLTFFIRMTKSGRRNCLCVGNTIQCIFIWNLGNGVQRGKQTVLFCTIGRVCTRGEWLISTSSIRQSTGCLTIDNIGCDCQDGCCRFRVSVCMVLLDLG